MKLTARFAGCLLLLLFAKVAVAQLQVGDDLTMRMNGLLTAGYSADFGNEIPSDHSLNLGGNATLNGDYYNPNFLNFTVQPYYNRASDNSTFSSLTDSSGINATTNFFTGSRFPGYASYNYTHNSTGNLGLVGAPNFTTIGTGQGFGVGWSALLPNWPTFSVSYSQGSGNGNVYGTNQESTSSTKTLNLRSTYQVAGWNLSANYQRLDFSALYPEFLGDQTGSNTSDFTGNNFNVNGNHRLPWNGSVALSYSHSDYSGDFGSTLDETGSSSKSETANLTNYSTNTETALVSFHLTNKFSIFANQMYTDNLNGYFYQNLISSGAGAPLLPQSSQSNSNMASAGATYLVTNNLFTEAQITYFDQTYFGNTYSGSFVSGTLGYNKRLWNTLTGSVTVIESSDKFANSSLGFVANLDAYHNFAGWETNGDFSYAQNVQTLLVTETNSYYSYGANVHRRFSRNKQWTAAFNGNRSGLSNVSNSNTHSESFSSSLTLRRFTLNGNYITSHGEAILTSTGIQPIPPTPGLLPQGLIVYNGTSYGGSVGVTPIPRLTLTGTFTHAVSDTLSSDIYSNNKTQIFYGQLQYQLRRISVLGGYTRFMQGISASGSPTANTYSYFIGVQRWFGFF